MGAHCSEKYAACRGILVRRHCTALKQMAKMSSKKMGKRLKNGPCLEVVLRVCLVCSEVVSPECW